MLGGLLITHFVSINERLCYLGRALNHPPPLPANPLTTPLGRVTTTEPYSSSFSTFVINFARPQTVCHNCRRLLWLCLAWSRPSRQPRDTCLLACEVQYCIIRTCMCALYTQSSLSFSCFYRFLHIQLKYTLQDKRTQHASRVSTALRPRSTLLIIVLQNKELLRHILICSYCVSPRKRVDLEATQNINSYKMWDLLTLSV